ncbi:diguanylate cyclase [Virgibacillus dakarensis]|uniref:sensor domain-containing diguanylate cyclase n=1 Tax=Virgibacillus dakarensis TaxID=1917889 RepID=UPI0013566F4B|nr:diguanylate cyclase [Virgibacillus dakarensis]MBT2216601.1 diguanylate cyclase [Virgibacillus dakarensis]
MSVSIQWQEKLRSIFFELIKEVPTCSYDELLSRLIMKLQDSLKVSVIVIYEHDDWNNTFKQITSQMLQLNEQCLLRDGNLAIHQNKIVRVQEAFNPPGTKEAFIIPITPEYKPSSFVGLSIPASCDPGADKLLLLLKNELEHFMGILNYFRGRRDSESRNEFLFYLTTRFYSLTNKNDILIEIINSLKIRYPKFTYYLLLSQDYQVDHSLPVKTIEYSDDETKRVSTQAFISGEVQLEDRVREKNTCLYAPLKGSQGVYGVLQIVTPRVVNFPDEEIEFMRQFANAAGKAIENVTLYSYSKRLISDLKMINDATHQLNSNLKLSEITAIVKQQIIDTCRTSQVGFIYYLEEEGKFDILPGSTDYHYSKQGRQFTKHMLDELEWKKEAIFSGDFKEMLKLPFCSVMVIPMLNSGKIHGMVTIMHEEAYYFSFESFKLMQSLIQHSTLALANAILKDRLENAVITDYLTTLYSRNYLDEKIQLHMATADRGALILFDIDDFKMVNDTYGHNTGDDVIKQVAEIIKINLGNDDIPARWGGEELAIYLPDATVDDGVQLATQIRKQAETTTNPLITLSCGVSTWTNNTNDSVKELFIRADKALYEAKSVGKNCVVKENERKNSIK